MKLLKTVEPWLAPLLLMGAIYFLSAQPDLSSGLGLIDLVGRKLIHALEYALLAFLWWRALSPRLGDRSALAAALLLTVGYAVLDEYHQTFVEGRNGSVLDVVIDAAGAALAALAIQRRSGPERSAVRAAR